MAARGWAELDVLFVSGDAYIDHPAFGVPLLARLLEAEGYRVGILAQPDWRHPDALRGMGRPRLFAAISSGAMDSMVNHYTAARKIRRNDAYTPGGKAGARPNRAVIAYTAAVKGAFKGLPVVIGGIEASLRRLAHYDYWDDAVRRSILVDSKADLLVFGMGEAPLLEIARRAAAGESVATLRDIRGTAYLAPPPEPAVRLPSFEEVATDQEAFGAAFRLAAAEADPFCGKTLAQQHGNRHVVVNPPALPLPEEGLDRLYALPFTRLPHPGYREPVPAFEQIRFSVTTHRGCFGGCAFCAITQHQGKYIQSRSEDSIVAEIDRMAARPGFRGTITDVGGPTANMYGLSCGRPQPAGNPCRRGSCLHPRSCPHLRTDNARAVRLLEHIRRRPGVRHVFVASGIRYDLLDQQPEYFATLLKHHVGGLLKVAPEAIGERATKIMRKPDAPVFAAFLEWFRAQSRLLERRQAVVPYLMAAHPGTTLDDMVETALFLHRHRLRVEQVQEFTPTPGTLATCIYFTGHDPLTGEPVHVPRSAQERRLQKALLLWHLPENRREVLQALRTCGRMEEGKVLLGPGSEKTGRTEQKK